MSSVGWVPPKPALQRVLNSIRGGQAGGNEYRVQNMPRAQIYRVGAIPNLVANTLTQHIFDTLDYDTDGLWSAGTPNQFTIRSPGVYQVHAACTFGSDITASYRLGYLYRNSGLASVTQFGPFLTGQATNAGNQITCSWQIPFNKGDTLTFWFQSGVAVTVGAASAAARSNGLAVCMISTL